MAKSKKTEKKEEVVESKATAAKVSEPEATKEPVKKEATKEPVAEKASEKPMVGLLEVCKQVMVRKDRPFKDAWWPSIEAFAKSQNHPEKASKEECMKIIELWGYKL